MISSDNSSKAAVAFLNNVSIRPKSSSVFFAKTIAGVRYYIKGLSIHVKNGRCGKSVYDFETITACPFNISMFTTPF